jgi:hypothetical protein
MTTLAGELTVESGAGRTSRRYGLPVAAAIAAIELPEPFVQDHRLRAALSTPDGRTYDCLVGTYS